MQKGYELLWGDALPATIQRIISRAVETGTKEAFHDAAEKLSGITSFIIFMNLGPGWDTDAIVLLNASQMRMRRMEDDPALRESIMASVRKESNSFQR